MDSPYWSLEDASDPFRSSRRFIRPDDVCYYLLERVAGTYRESPANQRISNLQRNPHDYAGNPRVLYYKSREIERFARDLASLFLWMREYGIVDDGVAVVPIPPSEPRHSPRYDDRMTRVSQGAVRLCGFGRVVEAFDVKAAITPFKLHGTRDPWVLGNVLDFKGFGGAVPGRVLLVDDVLTLGTHFRACKDILVQEGGIDPSGVYGVFLSRHMFDGPRADGPEYHDLSW